jgi:hypothetical protein
LALGNRRDSGRAKRFSDDKEACKNLAGIWARIVREWKKGR